MPLTLKPAQSARVRTDQAFRNYTDVYMGGHAEFCPASTGDHDMHDEYGRLVSANTLHNRSEPSCHHHFLPLHRRLEIENNDRPYIPLCSAGGRGADFMGTGRQYHPTNIYGPSRGGFARSASYLPAGREPLPNRQFTTNATHTPIQG